MDILRHLKKFFIVYKKNKHNEEYEILGGKKEIFTPIYGFYHVYAKVDGWQDLVKDQIERLKKSGLFDITTKLYFDILYENEEDIRDLQCIIGSDKGEIIYSSVNGSLYEFPILIYMQKKSRNENFLLYYFHTKGISNKSVPQLYKIASSWRNFAQYFIFNKYKIALEALETYDVYSATYTEALHDTVRFVCNNFYWSKSEYVANLPTLEFGNDRYVAETWLLKNTHNVYAAFNFFGNVRNDYIDECIYNRIDYTINYRNNALIKAYFQRIFTLIKKVLHLKYY